MRDPTAQTEFFTHELKIAPPFFLALWNGDKTAELRKNDRSYKVGDILNLREYLSKNNHYTGYRILVCVSHIVTAEDGPWLQPDYCMLSLRLLERYP